MSRGLTRDESVSPRVGLTGLNEGWVVEGDVVEWFGGDVCSCTDKNAMANSASCNVQESANAKDKARWLGRLVGGNGPLVLRILCDGQPVAH